LQSVKLSRRPECGEVATKAQHQQVGRGIEDLGGDLKEHRKSLLIDKGVGVRTGKGKTPRPCEGMDVAKIQGKEGPDCGELHKALSVGEKRSQARGSRKKRGRAWRSAEGCRIPEGLPEDRKRDRTFGGGRGHRKKRPKKLKVRTVVRIARGRAEWGEMTKGRQKGKRETRALGTARDRRNTR